MVVPPSLLVPHQLYDRRPGISTLGFPALGFSALGFGHWAMIICAGGRDEHAGTIQ
jgi:hypothetical protein